MLKVLPLFISFFLHFQLLHARSSLDYPRNLVLWRMSIKQGHSFSIDCYSGRCLRVFNINYLWECLCTSPLLKLSRKSVHDNKEMAPKSNTSTTLNPGRFVSRPIKIWTFSEQFGLKSWSVKYKATVSKSSPTRFKAAPAKLANHENRKTGHSSAKFGSTTQRKANQKSKNLKGEKTLSMHACGSYRNIDWKI